MVDSDNVRAGISDAITIGLLQTPLDGATTFQTDSTQADALRELADRNFDQAPVIGAEGPVGFVLRDDLRASGASISELIKPILPSALVSADAPLERALPWLATEEFLFVLSGRDVTGFVVAADLNKQPGRAFFFLLFVELELLLAEVLRSEAEDQLSLVGRLDDRGARIVRKHHKLREHDVEADLLSVANLTELFVLAGRTNAVSDILGLADEGSWRLEWQPVRDTRNAVAHPSKSLLNTRRDLERVLTAERNARGIIDRLEPRPSRDGR
jgi:hypothetical protein